MIQDFYDASKSTAIDINVLASLGWSESANGKLGYWDKNAQPAHGIMQLYDAKYAGLSDKENILEGALILASKMAVAKRIKLEGKFRLAGQVLHEDEKKDDWLLPIRLYKGTIGKAYDLARTWKVFIYTPWPNVVGTYQIPEKLKELWLAKDTFLVK